MIETDDSGIETLESWLTRALSEDDGLSFRDVHFDMLNHPISKVKASVDIVKASCQLVDEVLELGQALNRRALEWKVFVYFPLPCTALELPLWNIANWQSVGLHIEPPSLFVMSCNFQYVEDAEHYVKPVSLPFEGFPKIKAIYTAERSKEDELEGEPYTTRLILISKQLLK